MKVHFIPFMAESVFAGILISIAGWGFLANPVIGMFLFCVGLLAVVKYRARLYTGTAGFITGWADILPLVLILLGNIIGCLAVAAVSLFSPLALSEAADGIITARLRVGWLGTGLLAIGCGLLMSLAVDFARRNKDFSDWLPLLFAVPAFILCGFPHCVADAFYCCVYLLNASEVAWGSLAAYYGAIVLGNFIGCNVYRLCKLQTMAIFNRS
ncbi:MAG: formate/nitrite transporter family protein [Paludibacteraceae bacterium]|nr:formate/nitrite transporter family protein [Paludibacteraceae bacterium]